MVRCPICEKPVREIYINRHIDSGCSDHVEEQPPPPPSQSDGQSKQSRTTSFFLTPGVKRSGSKLNEGEISSSPLAPNATYIEPTSATLDHPPSSTAPPLHRLKRDHEAGNEAHSLTYASGGEPTLHSPQQKRSKLSHTQPLAERMRPQSLDDVTGQALISRDGVLRGLIESDRVPSMILWGGSGTGKTTIARLIAKTAGARFVELNSTTTGVGELKKLFAEAKNELGLTGRKTIIFVDEIHRHTKSQQDVFLAPVESGQITLIGATTENPSFKVISALLSRCRTFTLSKLNEHDIFTILNRALHKEVSGIGISLPFPSSTSGTEVSQPVDSGPLSSNDHLLLQDECSLLHYLAAFADGDARIGLNLLELAIELCQNPSMTVDTIKSSLTQTLVYDRAGDQHYDTISAFHKSVRGSNADAALYYLARMLQSGEDPLYIARRMVVIASEDVGLADNSMLSLATATYQACEKIGMPECRINLGHCTTALCLAPKSTRAYRALGAAYAALSEPGVAGLPVPIHLRNAPTRLMKELGYGKEYKYNPDYVDGCVVQEYLPGRLAGQKFLETQDLGNKIDPDLERSEEESVLMKEPQDGDRSANDHELLLNPDGD